MRLPFALLFSALTLLSCDTFKKAEDKAPKKVKNQDSTKNSVPVSCGFDQICQEPVVVTQEYGACEVKVTMIPGEKADSEVACVEHRVRFYGVGDAHPNYKMVVTLRNGQALEIVVEDHEVRVVRVGENTFMSGAEYSEKIFALAQRAAVNLLKKYPVNVMNFRRDCKVDEPKAVQEAIEVLKKLAPQK